MRYCFLRTVSLIGNLTTAKEHVHKIYSQVQHKTTILNEAITAVIDTRYVVLRYLSDQRPVVQ